MEKFLGIYLSFLTGGILIATVLMAIANETILAALTAALTVILGIITWTLLKEGRQNEF